MADETKVIATSETVVEAVVDCAHAPFVFFDAAPANGIMPGLITITLTAGRMLPTEDNTIRNIPTVVAYLRTNVIGAAALHAALENAIKMHQLNYATETPAEGKPN